MRICIVTFFYKPAGGGIPRYVDNISKELARLGHKIDIITASYEEDKTERFGKITIFYLKCMNIFTKNEQENKENSREFLNFMRKYLKRKPKIINAQNLHAATRAVGHSLALNMICLEKNIPLTNTTHSFIQQDENAKLKLSLLSHLLWEKIISVGSNLAESLFNQGIPSENIKIIHPPIDTSIFIPNLGKKWLRSRINISDKDFLIIHASRIDNLKVTEEKGVFTLLKALSLIKEKEVKLLIAAAPTNPVFEQQKAEAIEKIKETSKLLGISNRVIIQTFNPEEMHLVYNGADLFVMASKMESFGLVYAEALACGIPVIGTAVGGIPEVIDDGKTGSLVPPDNPVELSKTIRYLIKNPNKMVKMGKLGRENIIERFDIGKISKNLIGVYESIINKKKNNI